MTNEHFFFNYDDKITIVLFEMVFGQMHLLGCYNNKKKPLVYRGAMINREIFL
jgi:hypothetical protein